MLHKIKTISNSFVLLWRKVNPIPGGNLPAAIVYAMLEQRIAFILLVIFYYILRGFSSNLPGHPAAKSLHLS